MCVWKLCLHYFKKKKMLMLQNTNRITTFKQKKKSIIRRNILIMRNTNWMINLLSSQVQSWLCTHFTVRLKSIQNTYMYMHGIRNKLLKCIWQKFRHMYILLIQLKVSSKVYGNNLHSSMTCENGYLISYTTNLYFLSI